MKKLIGFIKYVVLLVILRMKYGRKIWIGKTASVTKMPSITISGNGEICVGEHCALDSGTIASAGDGVIKIGEGTCFGEHDILVSRKSIVIGEKCIIAPNVSIYDHDHRYTHDGYTSGYYYDDVIIGNHVWIGANVVILKGSHIGDNCIIGAGCIVKGNVPSNTMIYSKQNYVIREL